MATPSRRADQASDPLTRTCTVYGATFVLIARPHQRPAHGAVALAGTLRPACARLEFRWQSSDVYRVRAFLQDGPGSLRPPSADLSDVCRKTARRGPAPTREHRGRARRRPAAPRAVPQSGRSRMKRYSAAAARRAEADALNRVGNHRGTYIRAFGGQPPPHVA
jgi:hypothetical protein